MIDTYDKTGRLGFERGSPESHRARSWAYFQCSGQGPYFGQLGWFGTLHHEKLPSAIERYTKEVLRINGVIDEHLRRADTPYLMGDECKYIDLMFVPYIRSLEVIIAPKLDTTGSRRFTEWKAKLYERPAVKKILEDWAAASASA